MFKSKRRQYGVIEKYGLEMIETIADCLPRLSRVFMREEGGGVDKHVFVDWARLFVDEVADLTCDSRRVLLLYDGYRNHISYEALKVLDDGNLIVFAYQHTQVVPCSHFMWACLVHLKQQPTVY